ncbi:bifunctional purine biosynthesis protein PurH [Candidatus Endolissoclinum faulkneri L2]|uniref:Bifunctional purine biosynthesis protein PurH n=1 Tax=Candidatus Endolissoclinum faulkneri L2 TaxID=1193729 RepID=K7YSA7_9PROT|nr:bifunctional phosphoribosylaminoimidazolecarboxamide formyltransferase/IMP cyclohydrolase [Candidatus Endolissoclinum faulkneri]AFX99414.1 bifunctional purine biosynthesis protein PurH [Candidatus Endolissoclinum faulkneri L2]
MTSPDLVHISRALISVSCKIGLTEFASTLSHMGVEILSTGGSSKKIADAGIPVVDVAKITGFPEIMDGRIKTLHPLIHGGLLARRDKDDHVAAMNEYGISQIDLLVVDLYPFEITQSRGVGYDESVENIDIGGQAMIRAASKNHEFVTVIVDVDDYGRLLDEMYAHNGYTTMAFRRKLAAIAYGRTASYDAAISVWLAREAGEIFPRRFTLSGFSPRMLRYGENPHQQAAFYRTTEKRFGVSNAEQIQGKKLSYNNLNDTAAAFELVSELERPGIAIIKHSNPCGVAVANLLSEAWDAALASDPISAFGGIVAANRKIDFVTATKIAAIFVEVVIAPYFDQDALEVFIEKKNLRVLKTGGIPDPTSSGLIINNLSGGLLVQSRDTGRINQDELKVVTKRYPTEAEIRDLLLAFRICKHVKSNAIVYVKDGSTAAIGAGQTSRIDAAKIAALKAKEMAEVAGELKPRTFGSVVASDAFLPFIDSLIIIAEAGATAIIQPGGSVRDKEIITVANERNLAMVLTGMRHLFH